jgi:hypothetical protein
MKIKIKIGVKNVEKSFDIFVGSCFGSLRR